MAKGAAITRLSSLFFLGSCLLFAATRNLSGAVVCAALLLAVFVHTLGEMAQAAGEFELSFALAPDHAQGQYQGVFTLGKGACTALAPALLTLLCIDWGQPGWLTLAALFLTAGALIRPAARWAERNAGQAEPPAATQGGPGRGMVSSRPPANGLCQ